MFSFADRLKLSFTFLSTRLIRLGLLITLLCAAIVVYADTVQDNIITSGNSPANITIPFGGTTTVSYQIIAVNSPNFPGCDATVASGATITFNITSGGVPSSGVSPSPSSLLFTSCGSQQSVTFTGNTAGAYFITLNVSDNFGDYNTQQARINLTVQAPPNTVPTLSLPAPITAEATSASGAVVSYSATAIDAEDNPEPVPSCSPASGSIFPLGTTTVNCSVSDSGGLSASGSFTVTVLDTTAPQITVPANITAEATSSAGATVSFNASYSDAVAGTGAADCSIASGATFPLGTTSVTCSKTDIAGLTGSASFTVTVQDTTAPSITVPTDITVEATSALGAVVSFSATYSDIVDGSGFATCSPVSGSTFPLGTTLVTCSKTDAAGRTGSAAFNVNVVDTTAPSIAVPADITAEATSSLGAIVSFSATYSDIVDGSGDAICSPVSGSTFGLGTTLVTCSKTDNAGNPASDSFDVTVQDTTAPSITVPTDITVEATSALGAAVSFSATYSDIVDGNGFATCSPASGSTFALGTTLVTCSKTDNAGNPASASFDVTVQDTTAPTITVPADITAEATSSLGAAVSFSATYSDIVDGSGDAICSPASGSTFALGTTLVTCSKTDNAGNPASNSFDVTVQDTTAPTITVPADITAEATSALGAAVSFSATYSDIVDGSGDAICSPVSGSTFALGTTLVTCSKTDNAGNPASASFDVTVQDTTAPTITVPADITAEATSSLGAAVSFSATYSDIVDGSGDAICSPVSGSTFGLGTTLVTCSKTDNAGNPASASFDVTVQDTTAPTITVPADITAEATSSLGVIVSFSASYSDIVDGSGDAICSPVSGSTFGLSTTLVTCSKTDSAGNTGSNSFTVTVQDTTAPTITVPADITAEATSSLGAAVSFSATYSDIVDGNGLATCSPASGSTFGLGTTLVTCSKTDNAGNPASASFDVNVVDTTAPVIAPHANVSAEASNAAGAIVSYTSPTTTDAVEGNGIATCSPASGLVFPIGSTTITCTASDGSGNSSSSTFSVIVSDTTPPVIIIYNIVKGATINSSAVVTYSVSSEDAVDGTRPATCNPASGSNFPVGTSTISCTSSDTRGNTSTRTASVTVSYSFNGFYQPIDMGVLNVVNAGRAIPVKFSLGGNQGMNIFAAGSPSVTVSACSASAPTDAIEETLTVSQSGLTYDALTGQYTYVWKTEKSWAGSCRTLMVRFADGTVMFAYFKFTK
jgi:hypothetical protein